MSGLDIPVDELVLETDNPSPEQERPDIKFDLRDIEAGRDGMIQVSDMVNESIWGACQETLDAAARDLHADMVSDEAKQAVEDFVYMRFCQYMNQRILQENFERTRRRNGK